MESLIEMQKRIYPHLLEAMHQRYAVLHNVQIFQPIGRRGLAENTGFTERVVRKEVAFLLEQGLIDVTSKGMYITDEGKLVIDELSELMRNFMGLNVLEEQIKEVLSINQVIVVPGNSDEFDWVKREMGKKCVSFLKAHLKPNSIVAVTGGTSMAAVASQMVPLGKDSNILFVPARGGIGEEVENQSNTVASEMALRAKAKYRLLHVPDPLSETAYQTLINEPAIKETLQNIRESDIVIHGIGNALKMAERRKSAPDILGELTKKKAVSEAFGYYYDKEGNVVHKLRTIGIQMADLESIDKVITIAGGESKVEAIVSYFQHGKSDLLITDEAAAKKILREKSP